MPFGLGLEKMGHFVSKAPNQRG